MSGVGGVVVGYGVVVAVVALVAVLSWLWWGVGSTNCNSHSSSDNSK